MSAPVFGPGETLVGALTLAGPRSRFDKSFAKRATRPLLEAAARATRAFGGDPAVLEKAAGGKPR